MSRATHTFVHLELSAAAFEEIATKLKAAGYDHAFMESDGKQVIDMHGIAVTPELASAEMAVDAVRFNDRTERSADNAGRSQPKESNGL